MGTLSVPVPVAGFIESFSEMPRIAPPPLGRDNEGRRPEAGAAPRFPAGADSSVPAGAVRAPNAEAFEAVRDNGSAVGFPARLSSLDTRR